MITPADVMKQLALAAGFRVHVWDAVENGDAADSYFWKSVHPGPGVAQSSTTFVSPELAWRDCCEENGLLGPLVQDLVQAGWCVIREPGFIAYRWTSAQGHLSSERYASAAEAVIACTMALLDEETIEEAGVMMPQF